ncbi:MAG: glycerophosphodiester phosphodiesterase [Limisphaerales bacterium]
MKTPFRVLSSVCRAVVITSLMALSVSASFAVEIIAHRGASYDAPENTMSAMKLAWKQKADAIELDIHLSKDGRIVMMHDFDTRRIGGVNKKIVDQTWDELQQLDVGAWKDRKFRGERIPTLTSVLKTIPRGKRALIEIKVGPEILPELEREMKASGKKPEQLAIITFRYDTAVAAKERFPAHKVYFLHGYNRSKTTGELPKLDELIQRAKAGNLDGLDLSYKFPIDRAFVQKVKDAGLEFYTWTVNEPEVAQTHVEVGVDGITTDRPGYLRKELKLKK